jgi:tetratricopeptide (TPR) repeat protein
VKLGRTLSTLRRVGRADEERQHYRRAIELSPDYAEAWYQLSDLQRDLGEYPDAMASARRAIDIEPDSFASHYKLGLACFFAGDDAAAEQSLMRSNQLAIRKWEIELDGKRTGRTWFARPENVTELLGNYGRLYGRRVPRALGPCSWQLPCLSYQQQQAYLVEQTNVYLEGLHGLVYDERNVFATQHVNIQGVWRFFVEAKPQHPREIISLGKVASLHQPDCTNYYHWMAECLTRLMLLEQTLSKDREIRVWPPTLTSRSRC